ncbi:MAG: ankyrin repeat domain-containing protein [Pseudomonadota bacterium]
MSDKNLRPLPHSPRITATTEHTPLLTPSTGLKKQVRECLARLGMEESAGEGLDVPAQTRIVKLLHGKDPAIKSADGAWLCGKVFTIGEECSCTDLVAVAADLASLDESVAAHLLAAGATAAAYTLDERAHCIEQCKRTMPNHIQMDVDAWQGMAVEATALMRYAGLEGTIGQDWQSWLDSGSGGALPQEALSRRCTEIVKDRLGNLPFSPHAIGYTSERGIAMALNIRETAYTHRDQDVESLAWGALRKIESEYGEDDFMPDDLSARLQASSNTGPTDKAVATQTTVESTSTVGSVVTTAMTTAATTTATATTPGTRSVNPAPGRVDGPARSLDACLVALGIPKPSRFSPTVEQRIVHFFGGPVPLIACVGQPDDTQTFKLSKSCTCDEILQLASALIDNRRSSIAGRVLASAATNAHFNAPDRLALIQLAATVGYLPDDAKVGLAIEVVAMHNCGLVPDTDAWRDIQKRFLSAARRSPRHADVQTAIATRTQEIKSALDEAKAQASRRADTALRDGRTKVAKLARAAVANPAGPSGKLATLSKRRSMNFQAPPTRATSAIVEAVESGDPQAVMKAARDEKLMPNQSLDETGNTLLGLACQQGSLPVVQKWVESNIQAPGKEFLEKQNQLGQTPLWIACQSGHVHVVAFLLGQGADSRQAASGLAPLEIAAKQGHLDVVQKLVDRKNPDLLAKAMHHAARKGHVKVVRMLLKEMTPERRKKEAQQLLSTAVSLGEQKMAAWLIRECDANVEGKDTKGKSPMDLACRRGDLAMAKLLRKLGAPVLEKNMDHAVKSGKLEMSQWVGKQRRKAEKSQDE